jgi:uncharacterized membrane protein (DUF485 family)
MSPRQSKHELRRNNVRLGLILASIVLVFFVGFIVRMMYFGG